MLKITLGEYRNRLKSEYAVVAAIVAALVCVVAMLVTVLAFDAINDQADQAERKAQRALIQQTLTREKICGENLHRREACQALFERLIANITKAQQLRLACGALRVLRGAEMTPLAKANCPRNPRAP